VLLLHTLRTQLEYFLPLIEAIGPGFDLVAPDLPGHGRSSAPAVEYTATYFTDAVAQFLDEADLDEAIVVGESIGASIALALAAREPGRFRHVVALNTYD
jgi:pimeloyl-ACP methyl ester carboxylesterase